MKMNKLGVLAILYIVVTASVFGWYYLLVGPIMTDRSPAEIEAYVRENINDIVPQEPVLGGTWYVTEFNLDSYDHNYTGTVSYEDGHIQESMDFTVIGVEDDLIMVKPNDYVTLFVGDEKVIKNLRIQFNKLIQDNRCPVNANCIEAGAVTVNITLTTEYGTTETLNRASDEVPLEWKEEYKISIANVKPVATTNQEIDPMDYQVTFKVE